MYVYILYIRHVNMPYAYITCIQYITYLLDTHVDVQDQGYTLS